MKSSDKEAVSGPRSLRDPRSREYAIQTMRSLKRFLDSKVFDARHIAEELDRIVQYKHWEIFGHGNIDDYLRTETGVAYKELTRRLAQDLAQDLDFPPAQPVIHAGPGRGKETVSNSYRLSKSPTSAARIVARLKRDRPDIAERLAAGEFKSARAAARAAGIKVGQSPLQALRSDWKKASKEERETFRKEITN